jgi:hypothetical protein
MKDIDNWTLHIMKNGKCKTCGRELATPEGPVYAKRDGSLLDGPPTFGRLEECSKKSSLGS